MTPPAPPGNAATQSSHRIVLVHGAGHDGSVWNLQADALRSQGYHIFAPDLPGHGDSFDPALRDIASMAEWLIDRLRADNWGTTTIAGHSMGSLVALEACARAPELFHSLILVGTAYPMPVAPALLQAAKNETEKAHALINKWSFASPADEIDPECPLRAANLALMRRQAAGVLASDLTACDAYRGGLEAASRIRCRCALICGALDRMTPPKAAAGLLDALAANGRDVAMITLEDSGHSMMSEQPAVLTRTIRELSVQPT